MMFKYKGEWYTMSDANMWSAIVDHYDGDLRIWGGEFLLSKGDRMNMGEAYVVDKDHGVINLATIDLSWIIKEVIGCGVED